MITGELLDYYNTQRKCKITEHSKAKITKALTARNLNVKVEWDFAILVKQNKRVIVTCLNDGDQVYRSASDLAEGLYECKLCVLNSWKTIAKSKNYTLIDRSGKLDVLLRCDKCSADSVRPVTNLLGKNNINCVSCQAARYKCEVESCNMEYLSYTGSSANLRILVRCNVCKNTHTVNNSSVYSLQNNNCPVCKVDKVIKNAALKGWKYEGLSGTLCRLSCITCGSKRECTTNIVNMKSGILCHACRLTRYKELCRDKNCEYIKTNVEKDGKTSVSFLTPAGEVMSTTLSSLTNGRFATSDDNHWNMPYQLYVIITQVGSILYHKIGLAQYAKLRAKTLKITGIYTVEVLHTFPDRWLAFEAEQYLHCTFKSNSISREEASTFTSNVILGRTSELSDGSTEWFKGVDIIKIKQEFKDKYGFN